MDILEKVETAMNGKHQWEKIPFSDHHGWNDPDWYCQKCREEVKHKSKKELPSDGCYHHPPELISDLVEEVKRLRGQQQLNSQTSVLTTKGASLMNQDIFNLLVMGLKDFEAGFKQVPRNEEEKIILDTIIQMHKLKNVSRHTIGNYVTLLRADRCLSATGPGNASQHCGQSRCPFGEV